MTHHVDAAPVDRHDIGDVLDQPCEVLAVIDRAAPEIAAGIGRIPEPGSVNGFLRSIGERQHDAPCYRLVANRQVAVDARATSRVSVQNEQQRVRIGVVIG